MPPTISRQSELRFGELAWEKFEDLCFRLAELEPDVEHCQFYGTRGQGQAGIDIFTRMKSDGSYVTYQCKRENNFTAGKIREAVAEFCRGEWAAKAKTFVLCTKESLKETKRTQEIEIQRDLLKKKKISFVIWDSVRLSKKLKKLPELVDEFFGREWVRVFCGNDAAERLGEKFDASIFDDYLRAVKAFSGNTPYLALNETLTGKNLSLNEIYVPLPFNAPEVSQSKTNVSLAGKRTDEDSASQAVETNSISTLADVVKYACHEKKPVLLQGAGGTGKSTVLHRAAHDAWENPASVGLPNHYLPIVIRLPILAAVNEITVPKLLLRSLRDGNDLILNGDLPKKFFDSWSRHLNASWLVMLDGLDEVAAERRAETLHRLNILISVLTAGGHLVIVTSRPASDEEFRRLSEKCVVGDLLPFDETQRRDFATRWFDDRADDFLTKVQRFSESETLFREPLVLTPLLLTIAAAVYEAQGDLPDAGKNELYRNFINILFEKAEQRGLREELSDEVFDVARPALEELALAMIDRPDENTVAELEKVCAEFLRRELGYGAARSQRPARDLCEILTRRSGVLFRHAEICQWVHSTMREYLAAVALDRRIKDGSDYETLIGAKIRESKNNELLIAFGRIHDDKRALIVWLTQKAKTNKSADAAVFAYDIWDECDSQTRDELQPEIILALAYGFGEMDSGMHLRDVSKRLLVEMGVRAVEPLLKLLEEMNGVQHKLLPEWNEPKERPDIYTEPGRQIYQADLIRGKIIKILGEIGDERAIEPLISLLPQQADFDSYRYYVSQTARRALRCIGESAIAPLLARITNSDNSTKERCDYLAGLLGIGVRTSEASEAVRKCLEEGLRGNNELLSFSIWAAYSLRDHSQSKLIKQALAADDLDVLDRAALYFTLMPDASVNSELEKAFQKCLSHTGEKAYLLGWTIKKFAAALLAVKQKQAEKLVLEFIKVSLPGNGKVTAFEAVDILGNYDLPETPEILLRELARQLRQLEPDRIVDQLLREVLQLWRPETLEKLALIAADEISNDSDEDKNFAARLIDILNEPPQPTEGNEFSLRQLISFEEVLKTLAKCRIPNFGREVSRLLPASHWSATMETCNALWIAGDAAAESGLIEKLKELVKSRKIKENRKDDEHPGSDEYYIILALGTCATAERGVEIILDYVREDPRLNIKLPYEVLRPLLQRGVVTPERIAEIALDRDGTHEYTRNFCLEALGAFNAPLFTNVFLDAFRNESYEVARAFAAHALGWADEANRAETISTLETELAATTSAYVAINIGESLVRLKSGDSLLLIEAAVNRFGVDKMSDLLRSAAAFRAQSTFKMLPDIFGEKWHYSNRKARNIAAFGFYYHSEARARENVRARFEASLKGQDMGKQSSAVYVLADHDPAWLLRRSVEMFDTGTLEPSAKRAIASHARQISGNKSADAESFVKLYVRFLCDRDLTVRESAAESLALIVPELRQRIYDVLQTLNHEWVQGCAIYSLGFWDSDETEIESAHFHTAKTVRFFADVARPLRRKRASLEKTIHTFVQSSGGSSRVAAYYALTEQAEISHIKTLYRNVNYENPAFLFLRNLETTIEKRVEGERKKRADAEKETLCQSARCFDIPFSQL
ncbi:MAG: NACHT domain-containing protein [Pyrinomonadaceae bacterium]